MLLQVCRPRAFHNLLTVGYLSFGPRPLKKGYAFYDLSVTVTAERAREGLGWRAATAVNEARPRDSEAVTEARPGAFEALSAARTTELNRHLTDRVRPTQQAIAHTSRVGH